MSYIGAQPTTAAFPFDQFSGNGSTTAFTMSYSPASTTSMVVCVSGVVQNPNTYGISGLTLTFSAAPPTGTNNIGVLYLGIPATSVTTPGNTAYLSSTQFTATAGQTTFTPNGAYQVGFVNVIRNGSQLAPSDYTATNGTTVVLASACTVGDVVVIEVYNLVSVSNALPLTGGTVTGATTFNAGVNLAASSGNVGVGTTTPTTIAGKSLQISDRSAFFQLTVNNSTYLVNNLYYDGTNWRYIVTGAGAMLVIDASGATAFYRVISGSAGAVATIIATNLIDASSNFSFNSGYGSAATAYGCRAWVNFNSTGTVSIYASGNCSSITDNGVGLFTFNFATAMPDTNYCVTTGPTQSSSNNNGGVMSVFLSATTTYSAPTVSSFRFVNYHAANTALGDSNYHCLAVFR